MNGREIAGCGNKQIVRIAFADSHGILQGNALTSRWSDRRLNFIHSHINTHAPCIGTPDAPRTTKLIVAATGVQNGHRVVSNDHRAPDAQAITEPESHRNPGRPRFQVIGELCFGNRTRSCRHTTKLKPHGTVLHPEERCRAAPAVVNVKVYNQAVAG